MSEIAVRATPELRYRYAAGRYASVFLHGLREGRILASRCHRCARTLVPPRIACTGCFGSMDEIVTLPPVIENGDLLLPTGPGWGADVNEEFVRAHPPRR